MSEPSLPEESIFAQALEIKSATERAAFLDRACGDNASLRAEVEALLRASQRSGDLLDLPENAAVTTDLRAREYPGTVIGPYKLLEVIGEGGMGAVWMAEQTEPIQRRVAVKVVKEGMDSKQVLARFEAERQALALMDHPNIAKVLDAGRTPSGHPYFVMELVKGQPITKYCDEKRLGVRERLELFGDVCRAVQHAHQKGIIHRDLKPSNVLVAPYDGKPVVKVIDFGVAKATGQRLTDKTLFTGFGALVGTPEYMSPEQAEVNNQDIDTRSDIYSLGVLLYELLTGSTPLTRKRVQEAAILEVLRVIREEEPPRPSTRLTSTDELPSISALRHTEPAKLTKQVRGELDWIVMKALEKDRNRRYETANGFAMDVQRYLADEPVQACPPSVGYRLRKFARRNKVTLTAGTLVVVALVSGIAVSGWQAVRANNALASHRQTQMTLDTERKETEQQKSRINRDLSDALVEATGLREKARALGPVGKDWTQVREAAKRAETLAGHELADPLLVQRVQKLLAALQQDERDRRTVTQLEEIRLNLDLWQQQRAQSAYLAVFREYGLRLLDMKKEEAARQIAASPIRDALVIGLDDAAGPGRRDPVARRLLSIAQQISSHPWQRQYFEARLRDDKAALVKLAQQPETLQQPPAFIAQLFRTIANYDGVTANRVCRQALACYPGDLWLNYFGQSLAAEEVLTSIRVALALRPENPFLNFVFANSLQRAGRHEEAIPFFERAIRFKFDGAQVLLAVSRGRALEQQGKPDKAIEAYQEALRNVQQERDFASSHFLLLDALIDALERKGAPAEAIVPLLQLYNKASCESFHMLLKRGYVMTKWGKPREAIASYAMAVSMNPDDNVAETKLVQLLTKSGLLEETLAAWRKDAAANPGVSRIWIPLCLVLERTGRQEDAMGAWEDWFADWTYVPGVYNPLIFFGDAMTRMGKLLRAETAYRKAVEVAPGQKLAQFRLADMRNRAGRFDKAADHQKPLVLDPKAASVPTGLIAHYRFRDHGKDLTGRSADFELKNAPFKDGALYLNGRYELDDERGFRAKASTPLLNYQAFSVLVRFRPASFTGLDSRPEGPILMGGPGGRWFGIHRSKNGDLFVSFNNGEIRFDIKNVRLELDKTIEVACSIDVEKRHLIVHVNGKKMEDLALGKDFALKAAQTPWGQEDKIWTFTLYSNATAFHGFVEELIVANGVFTPKQLWSAASAWDK